MWPSLCISLPDIQLPSRGGKKNIHSNNNNKEKDKNNSNSNNSNSNSNNRSNNNSDNNNKKIIILVTRAGIFVQYLPLYTNSTSSTKQCSTNLWLSASYDLIVFMYLIAFSQFPMIA